MSRYSATEQIGVHAVGLVVTSDLGWIFREQPIADMGIDAHIELVDGEPTGKLIGVQIKTGKGNFKESKDAYTYYGNDVHLDYWSNHSLPVILVAHIPETKETLCTGTVGSGLYLIVRIGYAETWLVRSGWNSQVRCII